MTFGRQKDNNDKMVASPAQLPTPDPSLPPSEDGDYCRLRLDDNSPFSGEDEWLRIPDSLFYSIMSAEPVVNPHYRESKSQSDPWVAKSVLSFNYSFHYFSSPTNSNLHFACSSLSALLLVLSSKDPGGVQSHYIPVPRKASRSSDMSPLAACSGGVMIRFLPFRLLCTTTRGLTCSGSAILTFTSTFHIAPTPLS